MNDTMQVIAFLLGQSQAKDAQIQALNQQIAAMQAEASAKVVNIDARRNKNTPAVPEAN